MLILGKQSLKGSIGTKIQLTGCVETRVKLAGKIGINHDEIVGQTYILIDEDGTEVPAVLVDTETIFTATPNDIRTGMVAVTENGVTVGTKDIPSYHTTEGVRPIQAGRAFTIPLPGNKYEYTKILALICDYNTNLSDSVLTIMSVINDKVYDVNSYNERSTVTVDYENRCINLGLINDSDTRRIIRYITYKEEE